jgi:hypothetical protein
MRPLLKVSSQAGNYCEEFHSISEHIEESFKHRWWILRRVSGQAGGYRAEFHSIYVIAQNPAVWG